VVGLGKQAQVHWPAIKKCQQLGLLEVIATCDPYATITDSPRHFTDFEEMISASKPDAVFICSPTATHFAMAKSALAHGCHVIKEKPIALSLVEAHELKALANRFQRVIITTQQRYFIPLLDQARQLIPQVGALSHFAYRFTLNDTKPSWYWTSVEEGGGAWMNLGWHGLCLLEWLLGPITEVVVSRHQQAVRPWTYATDDLAVARILVQENIPGSVLVSCTQPKSEVLEVVGADGKMTISRDHISLNTANEKREWHDTWNAEFEAQVYDQLWLDVCRKTSQDISTIDRDIKTLEWLLHDQSLLAPSLLSTSESMVYV
jgi:UDP-N-acetyl-2-amino-2-deoxyglucuronate dehydrogenase